MSERATLRVGDVFLKIDTDQTRTDVEVEAMAMAPIPTPEILWRKPPVLALAALPGTALGHLGEPSTASSAAWVCGRCRRPDAARRAAAAMARPEPRRDSHRAWPTNASGSSPTRSFPPTWSRATARSPRQRSGRGHRCSSTATCRSTMCSSTVTRSPESSTGPRQPRATRLSTSPHLTLGHEERLADVVAGYGTDVDLDVIRAWWSLRSLLASAG